MNQINWKKKTFDIIKCAYFSVLLFKTPYHWECETLSFELEKQKNVALKS